MLALLGSAAAPAALSFEILPARVRTIVGVGAVALALLAVPTFISDRLALNAARDWTEDLGGAYDALDTSADLNPFADVPLLVKANIARQAGDREIALAALEEALRREPADWRGYYLAAQVLGPSSPVGREQLDKALELNPEGEELKRLEKKFDDASARRTPNRGEDES